MKNIKTGNLFIVAAPSGAGKTSLVKELVVRDKGITVSISHTTRQPRPGEENGKHYHFIDRTQFLKLAGEAEFLEHAEVFKNYYGSSETAVNAILAQGQDVILEIDWQGARQVRHARKDAIGIFILPPSQKELHKRLDKRGQDSEEVILHRMSKARDEMSHYPEFDYLVVNDDFEIAIQDLLAIFRSHRMSQNHQSENLNDILTELLSEV